MATILSVLQTAKENLETDFSILRKRGLSQLDNVIDLLEKGYPVSADLDALIGEYGTATDVPIVYEEDLI